MKQLSGATIIVLPLILSCIYPNVAQGATETIVDQTTKHCIVKNSNMHFVVTATKNYTILDNGKADMNFTIDSFSTLGWVKKKTIKKKNIDGLVLRIVARQKQTNKLTVCEVEVWDNKDTFYGYFTKKRNNWP